MTPPTTLAMKQEPGITPSIPPALSSADAASSSSSSQMNLPVLAAAAASTAPSKRHADDAELGQHEQPEVKRTKYLSSSSVCRDDLEAAAAAAASSSSAAAAAAAASSSAAPTPAPAAVTQAAPTTKKPPPMCSEDDCIDEATHLCLDGCGYQCAAHDRDLHADLSSHKRSSLVEQQQKKAAVLEAAASRKREELATYRKSSCTKFLTELEQCGEEIRDLSQARKVELQALLTQSKTAQSVIASLLDRITRWQTDQTTHIASVERSIRAITKAIDVSRADERSAFEPADAVSNLSAAEILAMDERDIVAICDTQAVSKIRTTFMRVHQDTDPKSLQLPMVHPAERLLHYLNTELLLMLDPAPRVALQQFLGDKRLATAQLLYKASRDGWLPKDFHRRCCMKGPTLTLIKATGTGFIFGAYTAVEWPKPPATGLVVPDPSGASFMFSLVNVYRRPFRMSLVDRGRAVAVSKTFGPVFGAWYQNHKGHDVKHPNLVLMHDRIAANEKKSNFTNHPVHQSGAYQIDAWTEPPPNGFQLDRVTLAGQQHFAAAEIEVYAL